MNGEGRNNILAWELVSFLREEIKMKSIKTDKYVIHLEGDTAPFLVSLSTSKAEEGLEFIHLRMSSDIEVYLPVIKLSWDHPAIDIHAHWNPGVHYNRGLKTNWGSRYTSKLEKIP